MPDIATRLCRDCANARQYGNDWYCNEPRNMVDDLVKGGKKSHFLPDFLRESENHCGVEARWFRPRVVPVAGTIKVLG